jgi:hypothetical protein
MEDENEVMIRNWLEIPSEREDNEDFSDGDSIADPVFNPRECDSDTSSVKFDAYVHDHTERLLVWGTKTRQMHTAILPAQSPAHCYSRAP